MATSTKRPNTISQTTGSYASGKYYRSWYNLSNLKESDKWADCGKSGTLIGGKNGTYPRPAPLKLTNFKFSIPSTAKITKITVYYRHYKPKIGGAYPNISAPTIDLLNVSASAKKGSAVPTSSTEYSISWSISPKVSNVNSSNFGVSIKYPANTNTNPGQVRLRNVHIVVTYTNAVSSTSSSSSNQGYYVSQGNIDAANGRIIVVNSDGSISYANSQQEVIENLNGVSSVGVSQTGSSISKSRAYLGETVDISLTISASSKITATTKMYIAMPNGVVYVQKKSGNGMITNEISNDLDYQGSENYCWIASFSNSNSATVTFTVRIISIGVQTLSFREETSGKRTSVKITGLMPSSNMTWEDENEIAILGEPCEIIIGSFAQFSFERTFTVTFPEDVTVVWDDTDFTVSQDNNVHTITKQLEQEENLFRCTVSFPDVGKYTFTVEDDNEDTITRVIKVRPSYLTLPYFTKIHADERVLDRLGNSKEYTLSSLMKIIIAPADADLIEAYDYNYRLGVFNTNLPQGYDDEYLFENAEWSQPVSSANTWEDIKVNFFYSDQYPLIFLITGEYIEANAEEINIRYTYPCLIEEDYRIMAEAPGLFEYPVKAVPTDEEIAVIDLQPGQVSNIIKLYDIDVTNFLEDDDDNIIIEGVTVCFDVTSCDNPVSIMSQLISQDFTKTGNRSLNIESVFLDEDNLTDNNTFSGIASLGGTFDLWGLDFEDFKLSKLQNLEINLQFLNNYAQPVHLEFNNLYIVFHYVVLEESKITAKVNGVDLRYFNVFIKGVEIKPGTNNDVKYLDVEGTDANLAYRANIREKEIEMEIRVPGCDVEETSTFVEMLARALMNKRDKFNKPMLNEIEFSHKPNRIWKYLLEDELDLSAEYTDYEGKIKLIVPAGTAYSKELTITNAVGTNSGIAKVNPTLRIIAQGTSICVKETISNQEWRLDDDTLEVGDLLRIDCGERKVYKVEGVDDDNYEDIDDTPDVDITEKVDFNSDWFLIQDDYEFDCENTAIIQSVSFNERW